MNVNEMMLFLLWLSLFGSAYRLLNTTFRIATTRVWPRFEFEEVTPGWTLLGWLLSLIQIAMSLMCLRHFSEIVGG